MNRTFPFKTAVLVLAAGALLTGCQQNVVYQRPLAELNQKAQGLMQAGDYAGAVARLESAHDLQPEEPHTTHNLAVAYQMQGDYAKAIETFQLLLENPAIDQAELHKSLGISYEALGDKLAADALTLEEEPKADKAQVAQMNQQAEEAFQIAIQHYEKAAAGLKNPEEVQKQAQAVQERLEKKDGPARP